MMIGIGVQFRALKGLNNEMDFLKKNDIKASAEYRNIA